MSARAVLFDLGNTLWHIPERPPVERIREETVSRLFRLLRSWGIEPSGRQRYLGRDIRLAITAADREAYESDGVSPHFPTIVHRLPTVQELDLSEEQAAALWEAWNLEGAFFGRRLFEDAIPTLEELRRRGYRLACVTNRPFGGPRFRAEIEELGLADLFDRFSISCDVGYMKPHPRLFEHALESLDVEPQDAVMVGDSLRADVAGAQRLGMTAVWRRYEALREERDGIRPDFTVHELRELLDLPCLRAPGAS